MNGFDKLIMFLGCMVEVFLLYDYFYNFFEIKIKKEYTKVVCAATVLIFFLINLLENAVLNLVFAPILLWVFVTILFDAKLGVRIGYFITACMVMIGVEFFYIILSGTTSELLAETGLIPASEYGWQLLLSKSLNFIIFLILKQTSTKSKKRMTNKLFVLYLFVPIATLGSMITVFYSGLDFNGHMMPKIIMTLFFVCMMVGNMLFFYAFQKYTENLSENARQQMELLQQRAEVARLAKIADMNENYNEIVHNTSHYLKVIGQLAYESRTNEICDVVEKLNVKLNTTHVYEYSSHKMLNTILSEYATKAKEEDINFDAYVEPGCMLEHIEDIDLIAMMGNILENSVMAAGKKGDNASIVVRIFMQKNGKLCIIKVVNDFVEELKEVEGKLISTKKEAGIHGIGIASVSKIAEQYDGYLEHYVENDKFNAVVVLPVK